MFFSPSTHSQPPPLTPTPSTPSQPFPSLPTPPLPPTPPLTPTPSTHSTPFHLLQPLHSLPTPSHMHRSHESFLLSVLSLTRTHLSLVAPLGPSCVHMACGSQVKPLRTLLFKLIDSQVPPALDQVGVMPAPLLLSLPLLFLLFPVFSSCSSVFES